MKVKLNLSLEEHVVARIKGSKWESASEYITDLVQRDALVGKEALKDIHAKLDELLQSVKAKKQAS
jgi:hypothetical protein